MVKTHQVYTFLTRLPTIPLDMLVLQREFCFRRADNLKEIVSVLHTWPQNMAEECARLWWRYFSVANAQSSLVMPSRF